MTGPAMGSFPLQTFYEAASSVAGALVGLLFVAVSVSKSRLEDDPNPAHRLRASSALTMFTNALTVSLLALVEGGEVGPTAVAVAVVGLVFVTSAVFDYARGPRRRWGDLIFLALLAGTLLAQLIAGLEAHGRDDRAIAIIVVVSFLNGIERSWELIGGPEARFLGQIGAIARRSHETDAS